VDLDATTTSDIARVWTLPLVRRVPSLIYDAFARPKPSSSCLARACAGLAPWQLARVRRHIERHLNSRITNAGLAALVRLNEDHFARAFKISVGRPPHAYLVQQRVEAAKVLLSNEQLPLCQVALAVGFADQAHLSRRFRETVGVSPATWRRQGGARSR
jgi:AraC family transcriptional regulator